MTDDLSGRYRCVLTGRSFLSRFGVSVSLPFVPNNQ